jgi:hypothetical protein
VPVQGTDGDSPTGWLPIGLLLGQIGDYLVQDAKGVSQRELQQFDGIHVTSF